MAKFKTLRAIATSKGRVARGTVIELSKDEAKRFGKRWLAETNAEVTDERFIGSVNGDPTATETASGDAPETQTESSDDSKGDEKSIEKMSVDELKEKAKSLDLPVSGTKADLIERITLAEKAE